MSHPVFISPSNSRLNRSSTGSSLPLCSTYTGDRRAQQALFMGCPTTNMVSFSPLGENVQHGFSSSEPSFTPAVAPPPLPPTSLPYIPKARIMYPSTYYSGNPGYYYDLMQNSTHIGSQTNLSTPDVDYNSNHTTSVPLVPTTTSTYIPSDPTVYFGNVSPPPVSLSNTRGTSSVGSSSATPFTSNYTSCDIPSNHLIDPELQSVGNYTTSPHHSNSTFVDQNTTMSHHSFHPHPVGFQVGCQTEFDPPSLEVKERKKIGSS
jgi:hypothetical protein